MLRTEARGGVVRIDRRVYRKVFVIGIGAGNPEYVTVQAMDKPLWNAYYALGICHCTPPGRTVS